MGGEGGKRKHVHRQPSADRGWERLRGGDDVDGRHERGWCMFSGDLDQAEKPARAAMPSFWDGYALTSLAAPDPTLQDSTSAIDVGASAVCNRAAGVVWGCSCRGASARNTLGLTENLLENTTGVGEPLPVHIRSER